MAGRKARGVGVGGEGRRRRRGEKWKVVKNLLLIIRVMCREGDAPSSIRDLVTRS